MSEDTRDLVEVDEWETWTLDAREYHTCGACKRTITPGETYEHLEYLFEGEEYEIKRCAPCVQALASWVPGDPLSEGVKS